MMDSPLELQAPFLGVYLPDFPEKWETLQEFENKTGTRAQLVSLYQAWGSRYRDFQPDTVERLIREGRTPMITWEPWKLPSDLKNPGLPAHQNEHRLGHIADGAFDSYIEDWARQCSRIASGTLLLRPMHEMNGDWYPWCATVNGNTAAAYIAAWRRIQNIFSRHDCSRVRWVWSPYCVSYPDTEMNDPMRYFPGEDTVDYVAVDGYNWGAVRPELGWQSFEKIFHPLCERLIERTGKPLFLAETACSEKGGDKAAWISEAFQWLKKSGCIQGLVWFNADKECDWRIESSGRALTAYKEGSRNLTGKAPAPEGSRKEALLT